MAPTEQASGAAVSAWRRILSGFNWISIGLGVTMTVSYGVLFYAFAILAPAIQAEFGWTRSFVFGAFSAALLSGALLAPIAGRMVDRFGGRNVLVMGTLIATAALLSISIASSAFAFLCALVAVEAASSFALYDIGFATLAQIYGRAARSRISAVTLIAGFSSTIFWPLCGFLLAHFTWREVYLWLAAINLLVCLPIHWALPRRFATDGTEAEDSATQWGAPEGSARNSAFAALAVAFAANGFAIAAVQTHFPRLFVENGYTVAAAAGFGALIGPSQVAARIAEILFGHTRHPVVVGLASTAVLVVGIAFLLAIGLGAPAAIAFALFFGCGQGLAYIVRGAIPLAIFGARGFGTLTGKLHSVRIVATAAAPVSVAVASDGLGNQAAIAVIVAVAAVGVAALLPLLRYRATRWQ
jgi:MFS family permease